MLFELKVALRFLKEGKSQTILIMVGIAIGVAVQIFLSSLIGGLQDDLINKTVGDSSHITIKPVESNTKPIEKGQMVDEKVSYSSLEDKKISNWSALFNRISSYSEVKTASAFADGSAFINKGQKNLPVVVRGSVLEQSNKIYKIRDRILSGKARTGGNDVIIGKSLAESLGLEVGNVLKLTTSLGKQDQFIVSGIFDLGNDNLNKTWIFMDLQRAQKLFDLNDDITSIEIQINNVFDADNFTKVMSGYYPEVRFESWQTSNKQLLSALQSQSSSSNVIQAFVLLAVALGISSVLAVSVMQKSKQIGILKAMGANNSTTSKIFLLEGGIVGLMGSLLGSIIGVGLIKSFIYFTSKSDSNLFPVSVNNNTLIFAITIATLIGFVAAFIPARTSARLNPIEVIRNG